MRWLPWLRREMGTVEPIAVRVHGPGEYAGTRWVRPGRVAITWEDQAGRVLVEADCGELGPMLEEAARRVREIERAQRAATARALRGAPARRLPPPGVPAGAVEIIPADR